MGRVPTGRIPYQPLTHLWERHNELARRVVAGDKPVDIARDLDITTNRLSIIMNSPLFKQRVSELSVRADASACDVASRISALADDSIGILERAIKVKHDPLTGPSPLQIKTAQDVLDRAGHGAVQKSASVSTVLTPDDIAQLKQRMMRVVNSSN